MDNLIVAPNHAPSPRNQLGGMLAQDVSDAAAEAVSASNCGSGALLVQAAMNPE